MAVISLKSMGGVDAIIKLGYNNVDQLGWIGKDITDYFNREGNPVRVSYTKNGIVRVRGIRCDREEFKSVVERFASGRRTDIRSIEYVGDQPKTPDNGREKEQSQKGAQNTKNVRSKRFDRSERWNNDLISSFNMYGNSYGAAWKPYTKFSDLTMQVFVNGEELYKIHLKDPIESHDVKVQDIESVGLVANGFVDGEHIRNGYRMVNTVEEGSEEHQILSQLIRAVSKSNYAIQVPNSNLDSVKKAAAGKVALFARKVVGHSPEIKSF